MTCLNKKVAMDLSNESVKALEAVAKRFGLSVKSRGGKFDYANATLRFEFSVISSDGTVIGPEVTDLERNGWKFGLKVSDLGREFLVGSKRYKLAGLKSRSYKYPVIAEEVVSGKRFKLPARVVKF